jgi:tRNA uridine 5-carbamoylmethylation protein Kti12
MVRLQAGNYQTIAVCVEVPLEVALERNAKREGRSCVPETVIKNMYRSYKRPTLEENWFDEIWVIDENDHAKVVERRINDA